MSREMIDMEAKILSKNKDTIDFIIKNVADNLCNGTYKLSEILSSEKLKKTHYGIFKEYITLEIKCVNMPKNEIRISVDFGDEAELADKDVELAELKKKLQKYEQT